MGNWQQVPASYFANGAISTLGAVTPPAVTYSLDGEGRPATANDGTLNGNDLAYASYGLTQTTVGLNTTSPPNSCGSCDTDTFDFDPNTGQIQSYTYVVGGSVAQTANYSWNANGALNQVNTTVDTFDSPKQQTCNYQHDALGRLSNVNCSSSSGANWAQSFSYDAWGNITKSLPSGVTSGESLIFNPGYNGANRMNDATYDADGNMIKDPDTASYTWDAEGRMTGDDSTTVTYDALGRTIEICNGPDGSGCLGVVYSPTGGKLALVNSSGNIVKAWVPLPGGETAVYNSNNSAPAYYEHPDDLGTAQLASTPGQQIWSDIFTAPFGETAFGKTGVGSSVDVNFTGMTADTDSSLRDFPLRRYSPGQGRWLSPDPAGLAVADPSNPQSWNRYAYVLNQPLEFFDPTGADYCTDANGNKTNQNMQECLESGNTWTTEYSITVTALEFDNGYRLGVRHSAHRHAWRAVGPDKPGALVACLDGGWRPEHADAIGTASAMRGSSRQGSGPGHSRRYRDDSRRE